MQLRAHPKMMWNGASNWPPMWGGSYGRGDIFPVGEEGVLTDIEMIERHRVATPPGPHDKAPWAYVVGRTCAVIRK